MIVALIWIAVLVAVVVGIPAAIDGIEWIGDMIYIAKINLHKKGWI